MQKELKYMIIKYSKSDEEYIENLISYLEQISQEIIDFFNIKKLDKKIIVTLWNSIEDFKKQYIKVGYNLTKDGKVPDWLCGFAYNCEVETLTLNELKKTRGHENANIQDLMHLILHEFVHACYNNISINTTYAWLNEGLATTISHQYDNSIPKFNVTCDEMINGCQNYLYYYTMFSYVLNTYGREYILKLIDNKDLLIKETPRLFEEVKKYVNNERKD